MKGDALMDSLDLLKSLTNGVNNKASSESLKQGDGVSYKVNTSLRGKKKSGSLKEVTTETVVEKEENVLTPINEEKEFEDTFIEDSYEDTYVEEVYEETFVDDYSDSEFENNFIEEENLDEFEENVENIEDNNISDKHDWEVEITEETSVGHKSEEKNGLINEGNIKPKTSNNNRRPKIDRGGNPFKRGPRKKKSIVEKQEEPFVEQNEEKEVIVEPLVDIVEDIELKEEVDLVDEALDNSFDIEEVDDSSLEDLMSVDMLDLLDEFDSDLEEPEKIEETLGQETENSNEDYIENEEETESYSEEIDDNVENLSEVEDLDEENIESVPDTFEETEVQKELVEEPIIEEVVEEKPKVVKKKSESKPANTGVISFSDEDSQMDLDSINNFIEQEETKIEEINEVDDKFKDCKYYLGMSVEEFLRSNPNYREALYVEHFYNKEMLDDMLKSGLILYRKGMYRL